MPFRAFVSSALLAVLLVATAGCGGGSADEDTASDDGGVMGTLGRLNELKDAAESIEDRATQMAERGPTEPIDFRELRDLLPAEALGFAQSEAEGSKDGAMGFSISKANATYAGGDASTELTVTDLGGAQFAMMMGLAWTMTTIDRETDTSFERTVRFGEYPGYVEYDSADQRGEIQVLIADRFLINAKGSGVTYEQLEALAATVDKGTLASWKDRGVGEGQVPNPS